ncbi:MAG TPA: hypothetical protein VF113_12440 [Stellaceae bacterium]
MERRGGVLVAAAMLGLLAGCTTPSVEITSNKAPEYTHEPRKIFVYSGMGDELGVNGAETFDAALTEALRQCGVAAEVFVRSPVALDNKPEQARARSFGPDTVLTLAPTNKTVDAHNGAVLAVLYNVTLLDAPNRAVWKAEARIDLKYQARDRAGGILAANLTERLKQDGVLHCGAATRTAATTTAAATPGFAAALPAVGNRIGFAGDDPSQAHELRDLPDRTVEYVKFRSGGALYYTRLKQGGFPGEFSDAEALRVDMSDTYYKERHFVFEPTKLRKVGPISYIATTGDTHLCFVFHMNFGNGGPRGDQEIRGSECWPKTEKDVASLTREMSGYLERVRLDGAPLPAPAPR